MVSLNKLTSQKKQGFTLAEVLITLGIIGVVAALTMPSLIQKQQEKETVARLKKTYSGLSQAFLMAQNEYGTPDNWDLAITNTGEVDEEGNPVLDGSGMDKIASRLAKYMKVAKICKKGKKCECIKDTYNLNGTLFSKADTDIAKDSNIFQLKDGTWISIGWVGSPKCELAHHGENFPKMCSDILVYLPTKWGKNTAGKDRFYFYMSKNGIIPYGVKDEEYNFEQYCDPKSSQGDPNGRSCTAWIIYNENMDYLHCDDLSWDGKTKCK